MAVHARFRIATPTLKADHVAPNESIRYFLNCVSLCCQRVTPAASHQLEVTSGRIVEHASPGRPCLIPQSFNVPENSQERLLPPSEDLPTYFLLPQLDEKKAR